MYRRFLVALYLILIGLLVLLLGRPSDGRAQVPNLPPVVLDEDDQQRAPAPPPTPPAARTAPARSRSLVIETIEFDGKTRTRDALALAATGIVPGSPAHPDTILAAAERLRQSRLFREVEVHTRAGSAPGRVRVVFAVKEQRPHLRFGIGHEDFSGWYVIPLQLNMDNWMGRGEAFRLSTRFGYRVSGFEANYRSTAFSSPRFWELRFRGEGQGRPYFYLGGEVSHTVGRARLDFRLGNRLVGPLALESWLAFDRADADSTAYIYKDRPDGNYEEMEISYDELPPAIRQDVGVNDMTRLGAALILNRHRGAGLVRHGFWSRLSGEGVLSKRGDFALAELDVRGYVPLWRGALIATRGRAGTISQQSPFYERYYLGGLYTVRGYPSHGLSPPDGHQNFATASMELRTSWIGPPHNPRLAGLVFVDAGVGWNGGELSLDRGAAGVGFGWRLRLPWIGYLGLDIGRPLSASPVDEAFHANFSLGWTY
jgi:outer membrane protein insertion porin family